MGQMTKSVPNQFPPIMLPAQRRGLNSERASDHGRQNALRTVFGCRCARRRETRRLYHFHCFRSQALMLVIMLEAVLAGCATVDPRADYLRAAELIGERTGKSAVFDPQTDEAVAARITALLQDGLSVDGAVQVGLLNNRALQAAFLDIGVARADLVQAGLFTNPSLALAFRLPEGGGVTNFTFSLAQQIADLWQIPLKKQVAEEELTRVILATAHQAVQLAGDIRRQAYEVLASESVESVLTQNQQLIQQSADLILARFKAGEVSQFEVNLSRSGLVDVNLGLIQNRRDLALARSRLANTLGLSRWQSQWKLVGALPQPPAMALDFQNLLACGLTQRLDARSAEARVRSGEAAVRRELVGIFPHLAAGFELERLERRSLPNRTVAADTIRASVVALAPTAPTIQTAGERRIEKSQIIDAILGPSLDITLPIWDQNQAQIARARLESRRLRKEYEGVLDSISRDVDDALTGFLRAREIVAYYEQEALPLARANMETSMQAYRSGEQSIIVVTDAQEELLARLRGQITALRDLAVAVTDLEQSVGGRLPTALDATATQPSAAAEK